MGAFRDAVVKHLQADPDIIGAVTKVYPGMPPKKSTADPTIFPFITVTAQRPQRGDRVFQAIDHEDAVILVKAVDQSASPKRVGDINRLVRAALNDNAALSITGYGLINLMWIEDFEFPPEESDGILYQQEGSFYQVQAGQ